MPLFGAESWSLPKETRRTETAEMRFIRAIAGYVMKELEN
jgi:hypothetical protein